MLNDLKCPGCGKSDQIMVYARSDNKYCFNPKTGDYDLISQNKPSIHIDCTAKCMHCDRTEVLFFFTLQMQLLRSCFRGNKYKEKAKV